MTRSGLQLELNCDGLIGRFFIHDFKWDGPSGGQAESLRRMRFARGTKILGPMVKQVVLMYASIPNQEPFLTI